MAIPQPRVQFNGPTEAQYRQQGLRDFGQAVQGLSSTVLENRRQQEAKRQYDLTNLIRNAKDIRDSQNAGDWVEFGRENPGMVKAIFTGLYGDKRGMQIFERFNTPGNTSQTGEQIERNALEYGLRNPQQEALPSLDDVIRDIDSISEQEVSTQEVVQQTEPQSREEPQRRSIDNFRTNIAQPARPQGQSGGMLGSVAGGTTPAFGSKAGDVKTMDYIGDPRTQDYLASADAASANAMYMPNGLERIEGVDDVPVPLTSNNIETVFADVKVPEGAGASQIAKALGEAVSGYDEEAAQFFDDGTLYLTSGSEQQWDAFDEKAQKYFGMDGQTLFAIRNQMFDNIEKGRPANYIPPENERTQWWWTGKDMPAYAKARDLTTIEDPTPEAQPEAVAVTMKAISDTDIAKADEKEIEYMVEAHDRVVNSMLESTFVSDDSLTRIAKRINVPREQIDVLGSAVEDIQNNYKHPKRKRVLERFTDDITQTIDNAVNWFAQKRRSDPDEAIERSNEVDEVISGKASAKTKKKTANRSAEKLLADQLVKEEAIYKRILAEMRSGDMSFEVQAMMPDEVVERRAIQEDTRLKRDQFEEAKKQFDRQMTDAEAGRTLQERGLENEESRIGLEARRVALAEWQASGYDPEVGKKMQAAELAHLQADTARLAALAEGAMSGGAASVGMTEDEYKRVNVALSSSSKIIQNYEKELWQQADGNVQEFRRLRIEAMNNDKVYKANIDTYAKMMSKMTGEPIKKVKEAIAYSTSIDFAKKGGPLNMLKGALAGAMGYTSEASAEFPTVSPTVFSGESGAGPAPEAAPGAAQQQEAAEGPSSGDAFGDNYVIGGR